MQQFEARRKFETPNQVLAAAELLSLSPAEFRQLGPMQWSGVLARIFEEFAITSDTGVTWLWENLKREGVCLGTANIRLILSQLFPSDTAVWLVVEDWDRTKLKGNYWVFEGKYGSVVAVLGEMHHLEYYIVDRGFGWMVLENHHNILVAVGEPAEAQLARFLSVR